MAINTATSSGPSSSDNESYDGYDEYDEDSEYSYSSEEEETDSESCSVDGDENLELAKEQLRLSSECSCSTQLFSWIGGECPFSFG